MTNPDLFRAQKTLRDLKTQVSNLREFKSHGIIDGGKIYELEQKFELLIDEYEQLIDPQYAAKKRAEKYLLRG